MQNLTIASSLLTVLAIILAIYFGIKSQRNKKPTYTTRSFNVIEDFQTKLSGLTIKYKDVPVTNLTVTKTAFWNNGRETINTSDITEADPLQIYAVNDCNILNAEVIYSKTQANRFHISDIDNAKSIKLLFDYLDKDEGGVIQIIHTGKSSTDINIKGTIKGAGEPILKHVKQIDFTLPFPLNMIPIKIRKRKYFKHIILLHIIFVIIGIILLFILPTKSTNKEILNLVGLLKTFDIICIFFNSFSIILYMFTNPYTLPEGFEVVLSDKIIEKETKNIPLF